MSATSRCRSVVLVVAALAGAGVAWGHGPRTKVTRRAISGEERAAFAAAKPALDKHCARCHTSAGRKTRARAKALKHFNLNRYPPAGHHAHEAGAAVRRVLLGDEAKGKGPTMPADDPGAVVGDDLAKIVAWTEAFDKAVASAPPGKSGEKTDGPARSGHHH